MPLKNVLILCTGNSARSILGEALITRLGEGRFQGFSAGSQPAGAVNPHALKLLTRQGYETSHFRSKSWDEFEGGDGPHMDFIFTVCDSAANETCPLWPGHPVSAHWGLPDPAGVKGSDAEKAAAFQAAYEVLHHRVQQFVDLPFDDLGAEALKARLQEIGKSSP
ncbi:MAG: arsenate reductase ArsC [Alphaproteobacteria bacterium]|nr:MAG: arsenate reductase ArsC [Alphaproteobacteria bacterium]